MKFLERDLEEVIINSSLDELSSKGLYLSGKCYRQLRIGNYGVSDLVFFKRPKKVIFSGHSFLEGGTIQILELKKEEINNDTFFQSLRYARGIQRYLELNHNSIYNNCSIEILLIGKRIGRNSDITFLSPLMSDAEDVPFCKITSIRALTYRFDLNGFFFDSHDEYSLINEGF